MKRGGRLSPTSKTRLEDLGHRAEVRERVLARDLDCRLSPYGDLNPEGTAWGPCFGNPLTVHHLLKASQGGAYSEENLVRMCAGHNDMIEEWPRAARAIGLVIYSWEAK